MRNEVGSAACDFGVGDFGKGHLPPDRPGNSHIRDVPAGLFDQDDLCPHLVTESRGRRVVVPLGECGFRGMRYEVSEFCCQSLPQRELNWGYWYPIFDVKLSKRVKGASKVDGICSIGMIRTVERGGLELSCMGTGGFHEWVPVPGITTLKTSGRVYEKWKMLIRPLRYYEGSQAMIAYDGVRFEYYLDERKRD